MDSIEFFVFHAVGPVSPQWDQSRFPSVVRFVSPTAGVFSVPFRTPPGGGVVVKLIGTTPCPAMLRFARRNVYAVFGRRLPTVKLPGVAAPSRFERASDCASVFHVTPPSVDCWI